MSKKAQIGLAVLITIVLLGAVAAVVYFVYNRQPDSSIEIPEVGDVREEYRKEEADYPALTSIYPIERVQAIEDNTNIRLDRKTGSIDFSKSDILNTPTGFQTLQEKSNSVAGTVDNRDILITESEHSFEDYLSNVKSDPDAKVIEETNDYAIATYGIYTWCLRKCPATDTTIVYQVGNIDQEAINYIKQYSLKEVG